MGEGRNGGEGGNDRSRVKRESGQKGMSQAGRGR